MIHVHPLVLRAHTNDEGYLRVKLVYVGGRQRNRLVHLLVASAFLGPAPAPGMQVRHRNNLRTDARLSNLAWGTRAENHADKVAAGTAGRGGRRRGAVSHQLVAWIRRSPASSRSLARRHGLALSYVRDLRSGRRRAA